MTHAGQHTAKNRHDLSLLGLLRVYSVLLLLLPALPFALYLVALSLRSIGVIIPLQGLLLLSVIIVLALSALLGHFVVRSILQPLRLLVEGAERIQNGEYGHTIDLSETPRAPLEFLRLMAAFNRMSTTVDRHMETIEAISRTDQLTGLCNRRHLLAEGYRILSVSLRAGTPCSSLMVDIDHFKNVNDTYGHPIGDKYLIHIAGCIASAVRESDMVSRYGGEEFVILAPNAALAEAKTLAERIRTTVATTPLILGPVHLHNTVSIGVAEYDMQPRFGANLLEDMIEKADKALYRAKQSGRNCVRTWPLSDSSKNAPSPDAAVLS